MFKTKYRYLFILLLGVYSFLNILFTVGVGFLGFEINSVYLFIGLQTAVLLIWEGNRWIENALDQKFKTRKARLHPLIVFFLLSLINVLLISILATAIIITFVIPDSAHTLPIFKVTIGFVFRVNLFLNSINAIYFFVDQLKQTQLEKERLKKDTIEAQFQALRNQINPHFLFNSLNVLSSLVYKDADSSSAFIQQLAKVYRYLLYYQEKKIVSLGEELDFLNSYLYLLKIRYKDNIEYNIDIPSRYYELYMPPASLQLIIENAIKHNIVSSKKPLKIDLFIKNNKYLTIQNNLQEKPIKESSTSIGLKNISARYKFISKEDIRIQKNAEKFTVQLPLIQITNR